MLSDIERKILRIISNYSAGRRRMPTMKQLMVKTGRPQANIYRVLKVLNEERYIEWSVYNPEEIVLLEAWERRSLWGKIRR